MSISLIKYITETLLWKWYYFSFTRRLFPLFVGKLKHKTFDIAHIDRFGNLLVYLNVLMGPVGMGALWWGIYSGRKSRLRWVVYYTAYVLTYELAPPILAPKGDSPTKLLNGHTTCDSNRFWNIEGKQDK